MRQFSPNGTSRPVHVKGALARLLKRGGATITAFSMLTVGALIAGCGGGGSSDGPGTSPQVVSGVAATGAPLAGGQVFLKDSSARQKDAQIADDGSFSIDVAGMKEPFVLKATSRTNDGFTRTMFSFAEKSGTANVNPFSSVALANAAGVDDPALVFDNSNAATLAATLETVRIAMPVSIGKLNSKLKPLLDDFGVDSAVADPIKDQFKADQNGLDGVFDNVKVVIASGILTITNVNTGAIIFTAQVKEKDFEHGHFTDNDDDVPKHRAPPVAPTGVTAVGGDAQVTITWNPVANATSYDLFYATKSKVAEREDHNDAEREDHNDHVEAIRVRNVTSPFVLKPLAVNTTYFFMVRAVSAGRRGAASAEVSASTSPNTSAATIPAVPTGVTATGGTKQVTISWPAVSGATSYNLYWSTTTGVTTTTGTKISGIVNPPAVHTGRADSTAYFYVVTAQNIAGESAASVQITATTLAFVPTTTTTTTTGATTTTTIGATTTTTAASTSTSSTAPTSSTTSTAATTTTTASATSTTSSAPTTSTTSTTTTPTTTTTTASTTTTTIAAINGAALFTANCSGCHGPLGSSDKQGASAAMITTGIANNSGGMGTRFNASTGTVIKLTPAQITAISVALQ